MVLSYAVTAANACVRMCSKPAHSCNQHAPEDMVLVLMSIRFYMRIVAFCMVFTALIALAAYLQTLPSIFQTGDFLQAALLRTNSQTAYLHNG